MGDHSSRDHRRESDRRREYNRREDSRREGSRHESSRHESSRRESSRREQYRGEHATGRPVRQATVQVYSRVQGGRGGGSDTAGPSNRGPVVSSFVWQDSSSSGYSRRGQQFPLGPAPRDRALDDRINQWMQRLDINDSNTYTAPAAPITIPPPRVSFTSYRYVDPNTTAPSLAGSHLSGHSYPSRPQSPERATWDHPSASNQNPVVVRNPGYVPPERRAERERANWEPVVENSERRRRRERREEEQRRRRY